MSEERSAGEPREDWDDERISPTAERELCRYLECGVLTYGFARVKCLECGHGCLIAFSCKGRGYAECRNILS